MLETLTRAAFALGVVAALATSVGIAASVAGRSDYYPVGGRNWQFYAFWGLTHLLNLAVAGVTVGQWQALGFPPVVTWVAGGLVAAGLGLAVAAGIDLGVAETQGLPGHLRTGGWYRYSRNPQYVGHVVATVAYPLWAGTPLVAPLCAVYLAWWLLFPLAEEPWLREQYGDDYERYAERVPRYVGPHTIRVLRGLRSGTDRANGNT